MTDTLRERVARAIWDASVEPRFLRFPRVSWESLKEGAGTTEPWRQDVERTYRRADAAIAVWEKEKGE